jgi:putative ribosome biogenesis GTPase RsgA
MTGKHTRRQGVELIVIPSGGAVIDTPGIGELAWKVSI